MLVNEVRQKNTTTTGFKGRPIADEIRAKYKMEQALKKQILASMPSTIKGISKFSKYSGEVPNIIINAIGTGLVAPIFIKYNFLSKTDDDTRTYSALRQPVSAILSVLTQAGIVIQFNNIVKGMNNRGDFSNYKYNKSKIQDTDYIEKELRKENPKLTKEEVAALAKKRSYKNFEDLAMTAYEENKIEYLTKGTKKEIPQDVFNKLIESTTADFLKETNETLERYQGTKIGKQIKRGEYLRTNSQRVLDCLNDLEARIGNIEDENIIKSFITEKIIKLRGEKGSSELSAILDEISQKPDNQTLRHKITETKQKCHDFKKFTSIQEVGNYVTENLKNKIDNLNQEKQIYENILKDIKDPNVATPTLKDVVDKISTLAKNRVGTSNIEDEVKKIKGEFLYNFANKHIGNVKESIKGYNQIVGLVVSLLMLPFTASLLNYLYPRVVAALFPRLADKKAAKKPNPIDINKQKINNADDSNSLSAKNKIGHADKEVK